MSSSDRLRAASPTRRAALALALGATLFAAGCQVRPLYGTVGMPGGSPALSEELARIDIDPVQTASSRDLDRVGQVLRDLLGCHLHSVQLPFNSRLDS